MLAVKPIEVVSSIVPRVFHFTVDYGQSIEEMVAVGGYDHIDRNITAEHFFIRKRRFFFKRRIIRFEARYVHPNRHILSENALNVIKYVDVSHPWMPAYIEHTLSYGAAFPEEQYQHPIVGLGSVGDIADGGPCVPELNGAGERRDLLLSNFGVLWSPQSRFLAVREILS